jgi:hypothetical protein
MGPVIEKKELPIKTTVVIKEYQNNCFLKIRKKGSKDAYYDTTSNTD